MTPLAKYEAARAALAECRSVDEVKDIRDKAEALRAYARQAKDKALEIDAREIRWRAERRIGEFIKVAPKHKGGRPAETGIEPIPVKTLEEMGIHKALAMRARATAEIPEDSFERLVARVRAYAEQEKTRIPLDIVAAEKKEAARAAENAEYMARVADGCSVPDLEALAASGARFRTIYADPPWEFKVYSGKGKDRSADRHYNTGGLESIKALPVEALAAPDCALFLWCVMPELPGALDVIKAWGFEFKTVAFTWIKQNRSGDGLFWGMGYWTRANAELCLFATRGSPQRLDKAVHQVLLSPIQEHSRKPDEIRERIVRLVGGPRLELYARRECEGWVTWGNEIPREAFPVDASGNEIAHDLDTGEVVPTDGPEERDRRPARASLQPATQIESRTCLDPEYEDIPSFLKVANRKSPFPRVESQSDNAGDGG